MNQYVCAYRGRRDNYQVPLALAEAGLLDQFITDFYTPKSWQRFAPYLPAQWKSKLTFRQHPNIPIERVQCLWKETLQEHARHRLGWSAAKTYAALDPIFSRRAEVRAQRTHSHLFLYTPYAWEAFRASYPHTPYKVLFQFHPHSQFEDRLLTEDWQRYPQVEQSYRAEVGRDLSPAAKQREQDCWQYADLILCASSFTRDTLLEAGMQPERCGVVPYGVDLPTLTQQPPISHFQALFVGSGIQRKGLHHLLEVWKTAALPQESRLILVCRVIDPGIRAVAETLPGVTLLSGVSYETLSELLQNSSLFVMPSLVEGFGQVFLEALSHGCPVLGTKRTCLPDLGNEADGIFLANVGDLEHLQSQLERLAQWLPNHPNIRQQARACATRFSWQHFRTTLCNWVRSP